MRRLAGSLMAKRHWRRRNLEEQANSLSKSRRGSWAIVGFSRTEMYHIMCCHSPVAIDLPRRCYHCPLARKRPNRSNTKLLSLCASPLLSLSIRHLLGVFRVQDDSAKMFAKFVLEKLKDEILLSLLSQLLNSDWSLELIRMFTYCIQKVRSPLFLSRLR